MFMKQSITDGARWSCKDEASSIAANFSAFKDDHQLLPAVESLVIPEEASFNGVSKMISHS